MLTLASTHATSSAQSLAGRLAAQQASAQSLRSQVAVESQRLAQVQGSLASVQAHLVAIEQDLNAKQARLTEIQTRLRQARAHLVRLQLQLANADAALASNLLSQYETDPPDAISVILDSHGFADMMDRLEFVRQAKQRDQQVIKADQQARRVVIAAATTLGALEVRQQALTAQVQARRDAVDRIRLALDSRAASIQQSRSAKAARLAQVAADQRRLAAELLAQSAPATGSGPSGPVLQANGFVFPMPGGAASPPGSWTDDQGVDISAAGHTPLLAVGSGTIVIHGIGGFGPSAPVLHLDSPIGGYDYVYYGHAGPGNMLPIGTHVSAGQVISEVGDGIVGISTGPHLEIGFADGSGSPVGGGSSGTMHALLLGAYHG
jgi:murein DD-endopeptidase MepM/ murein hydrolase activator NlpD